MVCVKSKWIRRNIVIKTIQKIRHTFGNLISYHFRLKCGKTIVFLVWINLMTPCDLDDHCVSLKSSECNKCFILIKTYCVLSCSGQLLIWRWGSWSLHHWLLFHIRLGSQVNFKVEFIELLPVLSVKFHKKTISILIKFSLFVKTLCW